MPRMCPHPEDPVNAADPTGTREVPGDTGTSGDGPKGTKCTCTSKNKKWKLVSSRRVWGHWFGVSTPDTSALEDLNEHYKQIIRDLAWAFGSDSWVGWDRRNGRVVGTYVRCHKGYWRTKEETLIHVHQYRGILEHRVLIFHKVRKKIKGDIITD